MADLDSSSGPTCFIWLHFIKLCWWDLLCSTELTHRLSFSTLHLHRARSFAPIGDQADDDSGHQRNLAKRAGLAGQTVVTGRSSVELGRNLGQSSQHYTEIICFFCHLHTPCEDLAFFSSRSIRGLCCAKHLDMWLSLSFYFFLSKRNCHSETIWKWNTLDPSFYLRCLLCFL